MSSLWVCTAEVVSVGDRTSEPMNGPRNTAGAPIDTIVVLVKLIAEMGSVVK